MKSVIAISFWALVSATAASAASRVTNFVIYNADTGRPIVSGDGTPKSLKNGDTLNLADLPTKNLSVIAITSPSTVGSVGFGYDGDSSFRTENGAPYSLTGNSGAAFKPWTPTAGNHTLIATPFSSANLGGTAGAALKVQFTVVDMKQSVREFVVYDADADEPIRNEDGTMLVLTSGAVLNLAALPTRNLNIVATTSPPVVGSVRFGYDSNSNFHVENKADYTMNGQTDSDYHAWTPAVGQHTITATPYTGASLMGSAGPTTSVSFTVVDRGQSVDSFILYNADTNQPMLNSDGTPRTLSSGDTINLAALSTKNLNLVAITSPEVVGSVKFGYDSNSNFHIENKPEYTMNGQTGSDFKAWTPTLGSHTIVATPYSDFDLGGSAGQALSVHFSVIDAVVPPPPASTQKVTSFVVYNADTDMPLLNSNGTQKTLSSGSVLDLATLPTKNLNIIAVTSPAMVGSVDFDYDTTLNYHVQNTALYTMNGSSGTDYHAWTPTVGNHTLKATPYTGASTSGSKGTALSVAVTVVDSTPPITPTPTQAPGTGNETSNPPAISGKTYYISSIGNEGDDSRSAATAQNKSTPWKTLANLNSLNLNAGDGVLLKRGGLYAGPLPIHNSGSANAPIIYSAYGTGAKPLITSLVTLTGWTSIGNGIWEASHSKLTTSSLSMVVRDGNIQAMGRYPNADAANGGYLIMDQVVNGSPHKIGSNPTRCSEPNYKFTTQHGLSASRNWTGAEVVIRKKHFSLERATVDSQSDAGNGAQTIKYTIVGPSISGNNCPFYESAAQGFGFFIENDPHTLDQTGEWYYQRPSSGKPGKLQMYFGSSPSGTVEVATADTLISVVGKNFVWIDNLAVHGSNDNLVVFDGSGKSNRLTNSALRYAGVSGLFVNSSQTDFQLLSSLIQDSNNNGIGRTGENSLFQGNTIERSGLIPGLIPHDHIPHMLSGIYAGGGGVQGGGSGNRFIRNTVLDSGFNGIVFSVNHTVIQNNVFDRFCSVKDDCGGIYTYDSDNHLLNGGDSNAYTYVTGNIVRNAIGAPDGTDRHLMSDGIYMDNGTNHVKIQDNTIYNTNLGVFIQNNQFMEVTGNTLFNNGKHVQITHQLDHVLSEHNIISGNKFISTTVNQPMYEIIGLPTDYEIVASVDKNIYVSPLSTQKYFKLADQRESNINYIALDKWRSTATYNYKNGTATQSHSCVLNNDTTAKDTTYAALVTPTSSTYKIVTNETSSAKTFSLGAQYKDLSGTVRSSVTLEPYTSMVVFK